MDTAVGIAPTSALLERVRVRIIGDGEDDFEALRWFDLPRSCLAAAAPGTACGAESAAG